MKARRFPTKSGSRPSRRGCNRLWPPRIQYGRFSVDVSADDEEWAVSFGSQPAG